MLLHEKVIYKKMHVHLVKNLVYQHLKADEHKANLSTNIPQTNDRRNILVVYTF